MTTVDYAALLNAAEKATAGEWEYDDSDPTRPPAIVVREIDADDRGRAVHFKDEIATVADTMDDEVNATFIVAAQPSAIIQVCADRKVLLDRIEALEKALGKLADQADHLALGASIKPPRNLEAAVHHLIELSVIARSTLSGERE